ncbi:MAG: hypothetical protein ACOXZQ_11400 [Bacteroidales bacterium]
MDKRLNICVLINETTVPLWVHRTIENLTLPDLHMSTVIINREPANETREHKISHGSAFLIRLFESIDRLLFRSKHYSHLDTDIASLTGVKSFISLNNSAGLTQETGKANAIADLNPDVIIYLAVISLRILFLIFQNTVSGLFQLMIAKSTACLLMAFGGH